IWTAESAKEGAPSKDEGVDPRLDGRIVGASVASKVEQLQERGRRRVRKRASARARTQTVAADDEVGDLLSAVFEARGHNVRFALVQVDELRAEVQLSARALCNVDESRVKLAPPDDDRWSA